MIRVSTLHVEGLDLISSLSRFSNEAEKVILLTLLRFKFCILYLWIVHVLIFCGTLGLLFVFLHKVTLFELGNFIKSSK